MSKETQDVYSLVESFTDNQTQEFARQISFRLARENYATYLKLVFPDFVFEPIHTFLAKLMETIVRQVEKGENVRLCISMPPRHGKSLEITETLPSWFVGRNPKEGSILTSYNSDLAEQFQDSNRQKTKNFGKQVFGVEVSDSQDNKTLYRIKKHKGGVLSAGLKAGITGYTGTWKLAIIDDPYRNGEDAESDIYRETIERNFHDSVLTRMSGKGSAIIVIQTRWHKDDLIGVLKDKRGWVYLNIPCLAEKNDILGREVGQTLCPKLGYDAKWAYAMKEAVGDRVWNSLYQGNPTLDSGNEYNTKDFRFYDEKTVPPVFDKYTQTWDLSFGGGENSDYVAFQIWGKKGANHYLIHRGKKKMNFPETCQMMKQISSSFPMAVKKIVEKKANGQAIIDTLNSQIGGIVPFTPTESKLSRVRSTLPLFSSGNIYFPNKSIDPNIDDFIKELKDFPNGKHDDEVDAMTQYLYDDIGNNYGKVNIENMEFLSNIRVGFRGKMFQKDKKGEYHR